MRIWPKIGVVLLLVGTIACTANQQGTTGQLEQPQTTESVPTVESPATSETPTPAMTTNRASASTVPPSTGDWRNIRSYLSSYVAEASIDAKTYATYDLLVLSSNWRGRTVVSDRKLKEIKQLNPNIFLIGYIGFGAWPLVKDDKGQPLDIYYMGKDGKPIANAEWGTYYIDPRKPAFQEMILNKYMPDIFRSFDGVFLDSLGKTNLKIPAQGEDLSPSAIGATELIKKIKEKYPDKKIIVNGGEHLLRGDERDVRRYIDGAMLESYSATWASSVTNPDGTHKESYFLFPENSVKWAENKADISEQLNKIRFQYDNEGAVKRDKDGRPLPSDSFFQVFSLDYSDGSDPGLIHDALTRSWGAALVPSIRDRTLSKPPLYDWRSIAPKPNPDDWGSALNVAAFSTRLPLIDDFADGVDKWVGLIGDIDPLRTPDSVELKADEGAARLDFAIGDFGGVNEAAMLSRGWNVPLDLRQGLTFRAKLSKPLDGDGTDKRLRVTVRDDRDNAQSWNVSDTVNLSTEWATFTVQPKVSGSGFDAFHPDKITSIEFAVVNGRKDSGKFAASLWIDDVAVNGTAN